MAYPTVSAPYGMKPVNRLDGLPYAGATRLIPMASGYGTAIFFGDVVKLDTNGLIVQDTGTDAATPVGVFMGCTYTDPNLGYIVQRQYLPASVVASDIKAYVCDDPNALFKIAVCSSGTTMGTVARSVVGSNMALIQTAGSTATGNSLNAALTTSTNTTNTLPLRVVDVVDETKTSSTAFVEIIVKINTHQYNSTTGV
jgi:hypothetical protein